MPLLVNPTRVDPPVLEVSAALRPGLEPEPGLEVSAALRPGLEPEPGSDAVADALAGTRCV